MRKILPFLFLAIAGAAYGANPQLGFTEMVANQSQPHIVVNGADRSLSASLAGQLTINFATDANLSLSSNQWQNGALVFTDTGPVLTTGRDVIYPNVDAQTGGVSRLKFLVVNATGQTLTIKRSGQTGVAVSAGNTAFVWHNGVDVETITGGGGGGGGAPDDAKYITQTSDAGLSNEQALSALSTGIVKNTTTTGVLSIAAQGTDYYAPAGTDVAFADGGTGLSSAADDTVLVSNSTAWQAKAIADCDDTGGKHLNYDTGTNAFSCGTSGGGGGGSPGGSDTQVQYNDTGSFAGSAGLTWVDANSRLVVAGTAAADAYRATSASGNSPQIAVVSQDGTRFSMDQVNGAGVARLKLESSQTGLEVQSGGTRISFVSGTEFEHSGAEINTGFNLTNPSTGSTVNPGASDGIYFIEPAGTLATLTVNLPSTSRSGLILRIAATQPITALTVTASGGATVQNAPVSLSAGQGFAYMYRGNNTTWYRLY